jgi:hypothetical protein
MEKILGHHGQTMVNSMEDWVLALVGGFNHLETY